MTIPQSFTIKQRVVIIAGDRRYIGRKATIWNLTLDSRYVKVDIDPRCNGGAIIFNVLYEVSSIEPTKPAGSAQTI